MTALMEPLEEAVPDQVAAVGLSSDPTGENCGGSRTAEGDRHSDASGCPTGNRDRWVREARSDRDSVSPTLYFLRRIRNRPPIRASYRHKCRRRRPRMWIPSVVSAFHRIASAAPPGAEVSARPSGDPSSPRTDVRIWVVIGRLQAEADETSWVANWSRVAVNRHIDERNPQLQRSRQLFQQRLHGRAGRAPRRSCPDGATA